MADRDRLVLLTGRSRSRHQDVFCGISLSEESNYSFIQGEEIWKAWVLSNSPVAVNFVHHQVTSAHLSTSAGSMWEFDGIVSKASESRSDLARSRQNEVSSLKCVPPAELALPVFVGSDPTLKPCRDIIIIKLGIRRLMEFPDIKVKFDFDNLMFSSKNRAHAEHRRMLEKTSPEGGTVLPVVVERSPGKGVTRCVLLLQEALGGKRFLCKLYRSEGSGGLHPGDVLRRRAVFPTRDEQFICEAAIGTIEKVVESNAVAAEKPNEGIVNRPPDGAVFPIVCAACKRDFAAANFSPAQIQVIDLWTWYYPIEKEKSLLERAVALLRKYPDLEGESEAKLDSWFDPANIHKTIEELVDPRSETSKTQFLEATANDPALRKFMNRRKCDYRVCYRSTCETAKKYEQQLDGRIVVCSRCGDGPVIIRDSSTDLMFRVEEA